MALTLVREEILSIISTEHPLHDQRRCKRCRQLLFIIKEGGKPEGIEIKCRRCKYINKF